MSQCVFVVGLNYAPRILSWEKQKWRADFFEIFLKALTAPTEAPPFQSAHKPKQRYNPHSANQGS